MDTDRALAANRELWDEWAVVHAESDWYDLDAVRRGECKLRPYEIDEVGEVRGRRLLHLQCQIGTDTIAWARRGAVVTGVDFSPRAVEIAAQLAEDCAVPATFVCADVLDLPAALDASFDIAYTSRGVLGWLPDLAQWARAAARVLAPGGFLYLTDIHPVAKALDDSATEIRVARPYFPRSEAIGYRVKGTYAEPEADVASEVKFLWPHSVGELVTAVARAGLVVDFLHEFPWLDRPWPSLVQQDSRTWVMPAESSAELPLYLSLRARKPTGA